MESLHQNLIFSSLNHILENIFTDFFVSINLQLEVEGAKNLINFIER